MHEVRRSVSILQADPLKSWAGITEEIRQFSLIGPSPSKPYSDGTVYRQIRLTSGECTNRWLTMLTNTKRRDYHQLTRQVSLCASLDALLKYEGLWYSFTLGTTHRWVSMRCHEVGASIYDRYFRAYNAQEICRYLSHILDIWNRILDGIEPVYLDAYTVGCLQGRSARSTDDCCFITEMIDQHKIFFAVDPSMHDKLKKNILSVPCLIPTLHTFIEDTRILSRES